MCIRDSIGDRVDRAGEGLRQLAREFAGCHRHQQCISLGVARPGCNLTAIGRALPANSRSLLMVITQETTQPLATLHRLLTTRLRDPTEQQDVGLPLMIPLGMVMLDVFAQRPPQGALTK